ncbi:autophagy-related protein 22-1 [Patellaria atrata CBS 101060]|uniref:Autophagy-related protein n=1 Tax=Patellaria atrata CBS 101060 TaxID=1346257 RepID=A0A9P4SDK4_9PEZI|nr:autophagy-related protein 22-1 [Patellaria atrata CBS 101060]
MVRRKRERRVPRYQDDDTRPTSKKELWGWYCSGIAAEVFAVCGVAGSFLPVTLEQLARDRAVLRNGKRTPCTTASLSDSDRNTHVALLFRSIQPREEDQCVVYILGVKVNTASFALYTFSLAVLVQALTLVSISALADHGQNRKRLLLLFGLCGALANMLFILVFPPIYFVGSILAIIGVTCLGSSFVLLNSFLPLLVSNDPAIRSKRGDMLHNQSRMSHDDEDGYLMEDYGENAPQSTSAERPISPALDDTVSITLEQSNLSNAISSKGVGLGYTAAVIVNCVSIAILVAFSKQFPNASHTLPMRVILLVVGLWWAGFNIPTALWLRPRPGPPLISDTASQSGRLFILLRYIAFAWQALWRTVQLAFKLKQAFLFLLAWFLLSDAVATISGTAILFAKTVLQLSPPLLGLLSITTMVFGIFGAFIWPKISHYFKWKTTQTLVACIILFETIPLYGLLGFWSLFKNWGVGGLQQPWEIFPVAAMFGFVSGGLSSHCRSLFGMLVPPGKEAAFFALYAFTDKGSSVIGPFIVGRIVDGSGDIRQSFWFLSVLIILPAPIIWYIDIDKGKKDALAMAGGNTKVAGISFTRADMDPQEEEEELLAGSAQ